MTYASVTSPAVGDQIAAAWGANVSDDVNALVTAAPGQVLPGQVVGTVNTANAATSTGATEALHANLVLTLNNIVSGRNYFIIFGWKWVVSVAGDTAWGLIHASQSAITTASPVVTQVQHYVPLTGANMDEHTYPGNLWTPGASGTWNIQAGVKRFAGTGNSQITAGQQNAFLTVIAA